MKALNLAKVLISIFIFVLFLNVKAKENKKTNPQFKEGVTQRAFKLKKGGEIFFSISTINGTSVFRLVSEVEIFASLIDHAGRKTKQFNSKEILISGEDLLSGNYFLIVNNEKPVKLTVIDNLMFCDGVFVEEEEE